ncbi:YaaC family protein [Roseibium alexandrii]|uniref:YaaC-like protein n=1 Tax=Roseibium alexandrii TaxID=388408 RepID=A0A0M7ARA1_9HYPH|nr:YaaC family protein [Roseibium alexandrii]CTQ77429.1 hypothetical protein LAX5112_04907 [Roseibium alexandrii]
MDQEAWETLSIYESRDCIKDWYRVRHKRTLNATQAASINNSIAQARAYFEAATATPQSVKPLILYYGVTSLSRALVLMMDPRKSEEHLVGGHGLETVEWRQLLAQGPRKILDLPVRATSGLFHELMMATANRQTCWVIVANPDAPMRFKVNIDTPKFMDGQYAITLNDLVSRDHRFQKIYRLTTKRKPDVAPGQLSSGKNYVELMVEGDPFEPEVDVTDDDFKSNYGLEGLVGPVERRKEDRIFLPIEKMYARYSGNPFTIQQSVLPLVQKTDERRFVVLSAFNEGDRFSDLSRTFMISYFLGMLVRYFPSTWMALLRNENGDQAHPLIKAATKAVEHDFAKQACEVL